MAWYPARAPPADASEWIRNENLLGTAFADKMQELNGYLQEQMRMAQIDYERFANEHRDFSPAYQVGQLVMLNAKNFKTRRPSRKLDNLCLGPFPIEAVVGPYSYRFSLPDEIRIRDAHPTFHTSLLRPYSPSPFASQQTPPDHPIVLDEEQEHQYIVDAILDSRIRYRKFRYLIQWQDGSQTWEPLWNVLDAEQVRSAFHVAHPQALRPTESDWQEARSRRPEWDPEGDDYSTQGSEEHARD